MIGNEKRGEGWIRGRRGGDGRTRMKRRKGEIGFTLSTRKISADNQKDRVKDKFHVGSIKNE